MHCQRKMLLLLLEQISKTIFLLLYESGMDSFYGIIHRAGLYWNVYNWDIDT